MPGEVDWPTIYRGWAAVTVPLIAYLVCVGRLERGSAFKMFYVFYVFVLIVITVLGLTQFA